MINVPWRRMASLDRDRFDAALKEATTAAETFAGAAPDGNIRAAALARRTNEMLTAARHFRRRLGPHPGWGIGDRLNLSDQLAQWMVTGSPAAFVRSYNDFVSALNDTQLSPGREATLVHLELPGGH